MENQKTSVGKRISLLYKSFEKRVRKEITLKVTKIIKVDT
jgi:hypothetical protein